MGSSFGKNKSKRAPTPIRADSGSEDEMDILSSSRDSDDDTKRVYKVKSTSKVKGKAQATDGGKSVIINGKLLPFHEDFPPDKKLPNFTKINRTASTDGSQSPPKPKSSSRPKPKPAYLGSSFNPIPVVVQNPKAKPNSKPLLPTSCTTPLHDGSPNRPAQARPKPRPAHQGAKKSNPDPFAEMSPIATDLDSPPKAKGKGETQDFPMDGISPVADRSADKGSSFPVSPLASPTRSKPKPQPFPHVSPLSRHARTKVADPNSGSDEDTDGDELGMDSDDYINTRGGPRPFPMSTQDLESIQRAPKRLSVGDGDGGSKKRREDDVNDDMYALPSHPCVCAC